MSKHSAAARVAALSASARAARERGDLADAALRQEAAVRLAEVEGLPFEVEAHLDLAKILRDTRQYAEAEARLREALDRAGEDARLRLALGQMLRAIGRLDDAAAEFERLSQADPDDVAALIHRGLVHLDRREPAQAAVLFAAACEREPEVGENHRLLAIASRRAGDFAGAGRAFEAAWRLSPQDPQAWVDLAVHREEENRLDEALALIEQGIGRIGAHRKLVEARIVALRRRARHAEAVAWITALLKDNEKVPWLHVQMATTLLNFDRERANRHYERARELDPRDPRIVVALAESLNRTRGASEGDNIAAAYALARERMAMGGDLRPDARALTGIFLRNADFAATAALGSFEDLGEYWAATSADTALQLLLSQVETPEHRRQLVGWHAHATRRMEEEATRAPLSPPPAPAPIGRAKIRIGLMSSDLRDHPVGYFVRSLIEHYDRDRFEIYAYSWYTRPPDSVQAWMASRIDAFRHKAPISERAAARLIADDRLDVLFDLGGTTDMNKLGVMAWRPAERQASWLGYPHSAGLGAIDRILVDPYIAPRDPALLIEKPFTVARTWVAFEKPGFGADFAIDPVPPEVRNGHVTFGTMNNPFKYNPAVFATWAAVMRRVGGSRFVFVRPEGAVASFRANVEALFASHGISPERIDYVPVRGVHLPHYDRMDIALDTFPQTGGTTTCETLWMGVPVVSLVGEAFFERLSLSNLSNAGLGELAVDTPAAYVETAVRLASDTERRAELRRTMRERLRSHPLGDAAGFARDFQDAVVAWMDEPRG